MVINPSARQVLLARAQSPQEWRLGSYHLVRQWDFLLSFHSCPTCNRYEVSADYSTASSFILHRHFPKYIFCASNLILASASLRSQTDTEWNYSVDETIQYWSKSSKARKRKAYGLGRTTYNLFTDDYIENPKVFIKNLLELSVVRLQYTKPVYKNKV